MAKWYRVIEDFDDLKDLDERGNPFQYNVGDAYPAEGRRKPTQARIKDLSTASRNRRKKRLIEAVEDEE